MKFTLGQAAKETGKGKGTISRDIHSGKISAEKMPDGSYQIDASELFRVYPRVTAEQAETGSEDPSWNDPERGGNPSETFAGTDVLVAQLKALREQMQMADRMHERELGLLNDRIEELRQDREDLRGERDSLLKTLQEQAVSVRLLTDQSTKAPPPPPPASPPADQTPRRGLFARLFRPAA